MGQFVNLVGYRSDRLTVRGIHPDRANGVRWICDCKCGGEVTLRTARLTGGRPTRSCGCVLREMPPHNKSHGRTGSYLYRTWTLIVQRCTNPNNPAYPRYGGRGITVCPRWREAFENFAADMGERPSDEYSVDRKDNDLGYWCGQSDCPECGPLGREPNCRWATNAEQARNTRRNKLITANGVTQTLQDWANQTGINRRTIAARLKKGWDDEDAVNTPVR